MCIFKAISVASKRLDFFGSCFKDNSVTAADLATCYDTELPIFRPVLYQSLHGLRQLCTSHGVVWEPCLSFMVGAPEACNETSVGMTREAQQQQQQQCSIDLPPDIRFGFFNIIRNPIDAVVSAFLFHSQRPTSEPWLFKPYNISSLREKLRWAGAEEGTIDRLVVVGAEAEATYADVLTTLPPEDGVVLEFWHSLPEVASTARQYRILKYHQGAFQPRFEDLRDRYNHTLLAALDRLSFPSVSPLQILEASLEGGCDPGAWTLEQRTKSTHVTTGKYEGIKEAVEAALLAYAPAKTILCQLAADMEYLDDARCGFAYVVGEKLHTETE